MSAPTREDAAPTTTPAERPLVYTVPGVTPGLVASLAAEAEASGADGVVSSRESFTDLPLAEYPRATRETVEGAARRARDAQARWAQTPVRERAALLGRLHKALRRDRDVILALTQAETGKSRIHAFDEFMHVLLVAEWCERNASAILRPERRRAAVPGLTSAELRRHPHGLVGHISPWNYPLSLAVSDALAPLVAGNAVLHKPDTQTALVALYVRRLAVECGLDPDLWVIVVGDGPVVGPCVVEASDAVSFTGSTPTGIDVARRAASRLLPVSLELGGKNGMIVAPGADYEAAAEAAVRGCFSSAGQLCVSIERIVLVGEAYEPFRDAFVRRTRAARLGAGYGDDYEIGTMTGPAQVERTESHVRDALERGARALTGGRRRPDLGPFAFEPTILEDVPDDARCRREETFGPVVALSRVSTVDEAVDAVNDTPYGLNASVWAATRREGRQIAGRLRSGSVNVNEAFAAAFSAVDSPMQGYGLSGVGGRHGREALEHMTWTQTIATQNGPGFGVPAGVPTAAFIGAMTVGLGALRAVRALRRR
ncbi:succinic semialdehyde dehydrogenase [Falsarthrobacter nasiphocae]|uniref:Succinate-semialdehyde dehydrogenase/glutarate-semialdehyde dehydrogenase n=1 Tax=Falsarthrobacter nasiphocae TaxID=189863 RepID=A0AAE3YH50_9MICC|nr:succinic semialdehyde dehydrogenase [Falsarthrobacter nasiphocae]MDR6891706.1 succinate-semialdehyde dehydrogenase/glutarate-semialdehyde dehydrogenase [Falsarthrobacter nasiphocae]